MTSENKKLSTEELEMLALQAWATVQTMSAPELLRGLKKWHEAQKGEKLMCTTDLQRDAVIVPRTAISITNLKVAADILKDRMPDTSLLLTAIASTAESMYPDRLKHTVSCCKCGSTVELPSVGNNEVSITPLDGWKAPPPTCPKCFKADPPATHEQA